MKKQLKTSWLLPLVILLFTLDVLLLPVCLHFSYAGSARTPASTLTYTTGKLTWDSATGIRPDGTAEIDFFDRTYENVQSSDEDNVFAPGTGEERKIRLVNKASQKISYKACIYRLQENPKIPLACALNGSGFTDTTVLPALPKGVESKDVLRTVEGTLPGGMLQDFDVSWNWPFERGKDEEDTALGNQGLDEATLGFYIVVQDDTEDIPANRPRTGDEAPLAAYGTLVAVSLLVLLLLFLTREKEKR